MTFASLIGYAVIYTVWLKRATSQNIVIGGAAGAAPPVLGWAAVTNSIDPNALLLFLIVFVWTPPHFWALAIARKDEYAKVGIPMLPVTHGVAFTRLQVLLYTILLTAVTLMPFVTGMSGLIYLGAALVLNGMFVYYACDNAHRTRTPSHEGVPLLDHLSHVAVRGTAHRPLSTDHPGPSARTPDHGALTAPAASAIAGRTSS